jgi:hypothetical protein
MRSTFITAVMLVNQMHAQFYADGAAAAVAYEARTFACPRVDASKPTLQSSPSQETDRATSPPAAAASRAAAQESGDLPTKSQASTMAAAAVNAAAQVAEAAAAASVLVACKGQQTCPVYVTPAVLQTVIARPLVAVQTSLLMDTVAWQRGVLATPPVSMSSPYCYEENIRSLAAPYFEHPCLYCCMLLHSSVRAHLERQPGGCC